jgi:uncharacterized protein YigE (DUF2233 family)
MNVKILAIIIFSSFALTGCSVGSISQVPDISGPISTIGKIASKEEAIVIKLEPQEYNAYIEYDPAANYISRWQGSGEEIIINGGYFNEDYSPSGFLVKNGVRVGNKMFDQDKSGLVSIAQGGISIRDLAVNPIKKNETFEFALQSYPFLIKNGKPALTEDSGKTAKRTILALDAQDNVYIIVLLTDVSLYEAMNTLIDLKIPLTQALNLDGGPSTGIYKNWSGESYWHEGYNKIPSIIRFKKKTSSLPVEPV